MAFVPIEELGEIEGFDESLAAELRQRAQNYLVERDEKLVQEWKSLGVSEEIAAIEMLSAGMAVSLGNAGVMSLDDLPGLASDELREIVGEKELSTDEADSVIMAARAHWFAEEAGGQSQDMVAAGEEVSTQDTSDDSGKTIN